MSALKRVALGALRVPGVARPLGALLRDRAVIFMLHRFRVPDLGVEGLDVETLRALLGHLRRHDHELVSLEEVFRRIAGDGPSPDGCIAFTLDDGYFDQAQVAGPVFAEFDCPATTFVTAGFLDGQLWFWWDRVEYVFEHTSRTRLDLEVGGRTVQLAWDDRPERDRARDTFVELCKTVPDAEKHESIARLARVAEVDPPDAPPERYAPMAWSDLRTWEDRGLRYGAHTVTHPVLSQTDDAQSKHELVHGWERLAAEASRPSRVFCYPNGQLGDFGEREIRTLRELDMLGAVVGAPGYASKQRFAESEAAPFEVRRFSLPDSLDDLVQLVSGFERLKQLVRREADA